MGYTDNNPYYNPERLGLRPITQVEWYEPCYSFDYTTVWKHDATGVYYFGSDSGCSCPVPFEDVNSLDDLEHGTAHEAIKYVSDVDERTSGPGNRTYWEPQVARAVELILQSR